MQARLRMKEGGFFVRLVWLVDGDLYTFFFSFPENVQLYYHPSF